jgi:Tfp pilus assembly protein PilO
MIWREKRIVLIVLGVLLAANAVFFLTYRVRYEERLKDQQLRKDQAEGRLNEARAHRAAAEKQYAAIRQTQRDIQAIYDERWSTQKARLAPMIVEVQRLVAASGLTPRSYGLAEQVEKKDLGTRSVTINFGVAGTYQQIRRFINLSELSSQFMSIDQLSLATSGGADPNQLALTVRVKTLFRDNENSPTVPASGGNS